MSRIGKAPILIPSGVTVTVSGSNVAIKGPKGELSHTLLPGIAATAAEGKLTLSIDRENDKHLRAQWGLTRAILANHVHGVKEGYKISLQIEGVGYKFDITGPTKLSLAVGFSHKVVLDAPQGVTITADEKEKSIIHIAGIDKQVVGYFASLVRAQKKPEPYKGKGIHYLGERIRRKAGKTAGK